jgi:hypothetical protein
MSLSRNRTQKWSRGGAAFALPLDYLKDIDQRHRLVVSLSLKAALYRENPPEVPLIGLTFAIVDNLPDPARHFHAAVPALPATTHVLRGRLRQIAQSEEPTSQGSQPQHQAERRPDALTY